MVKQLQFTLLFLITVLFATSGFSQNWYEMTSQDPVKVDEVKKVAEKHFEIVGTGSHTGYKLYRRWLDNATKRMDKDGYLYTSYHVSNEINKFKKHTKSNKQNRAADSENSWSPMGPFDIEDNNSIGRVTAIAVEPIDQELLFIGSPGGGIWRSRDAGANWTPIGDHLEDMDIWAIAIDPNDLNHILHTNKVSNLLESFDQGDTWTKKVINNETQDLTRMIKFHPTIQGTYFYTMASGIFKTTSEGTPTKVLNENIEDIFFKPGDPTTMYACGRDFWKSTNSGDSWSKITNGILRSERMKMTITEADPNRVYLVQAQGSQFGRIYKSTDSGNSFTVMSDLNDGAPSYLGLQAWRDMAIMCSNTNPEELHMGGLRYHRSSDGGATFDELSHGGYGSDQTSYIHPDVEIMINVGETLYAGTDGGIFRSTDAGENMTGLHGNGLMITQIFRMGGTAPYPGTGKGSDPYMMIGGFQDNGTKITKGVDNNWFGWIGSDGMEAFIDYTDDNILYGEKQFGKIYRSTDGGQRNTLLSAPEPRGNWVTPFEMDPKVPTTLYVGYSELYKSTNSGDDWEAITTRQAGGQRLNEITIAPSDNNYIYFSQAGRLWVSENAQSNNISWRQISGINSINFVRYITVDPNDPLHVIITGANVLESKDAGITWVDITGNLPDIGANTVIMDSTDENRIYVGMQKGIYYKDDNMTEWELFGKGLPNCDITELEIHYQAKELRVSTYGRGIWRIPIFGTEGAIFPESIAETGGKCEGDPVEIGVENNYTWGEERSYQWFKNGIEISGATSATYEALEEANYSVKVIANGISGTSPETSVDFLETPNAPSVTDMKLCESGSVTLTAVGSEDGVIKWYSDKEGTNELAEGENYSVTISQTSTFYAREIPATSVSKVGMEDNSALTGSFHQGGQYLIMDVESPFTLASVKVYAENTRNRTFELRDANNSLLLSKVIAVEAGESRVNLDFSIPVGNNLRIGVANGAQLYRTQGSIPYPFAIDGVVTIKESSATSSSKGFYYYLYDWEVQSSNAAGCPSPSSEVTIMIDNCVGLSTSENQNLRLFPNPTYGLVNLELPEGFDLTKIEVTDLRGNTFLAYSEYVEQIDLKGFNAGIYLVKVAGEQGTKVFKVKIH